MAIVISTTDSDSAMIDDKPLRKALGRALNLISYRQRTERELREKLADRFEEEVIDRAVDYLKEQSLVDDEAFAHAWSDSRTRTSPRSGRAIVRELTAKGISRSFADEAVIELDDEETARIAAAKFARRLSGNNYEQFHRRMWQHLQRRGYSGAVTRRAVAELWKERVAH